MKEIPTLSATLIRELAKDEPELTIHFGMDTKEILYKGGRWSVINELLGRLNYYEEIANQAEVNPNKTETVL